MVDTILAMPDIIGKFERGDKVFTAFEQVKTVRSRLYDLKSSDDPGVRKIATDLWVKLTETMDHPISSNQEFLRLAKRAANANTFSSEVTLEPWNSSFSRRSKSTRKWGFLDSPAG